MKKKFLILSIAFLFATAAVMANTQIQADDAVEAKIDASQQGEPISPYIYGQFIEHLGRCIYGGIWAEMLQDRKFHDSPNVYPWELIGNAKFEFSKEGSFVGEATPKWISDNNWAFGVEQPGIAFVNGKNTSVTYG